MKINSGDYKYRKLEIPEGIRPTTEKVREAVFSMLIGKIQDATVLDLFAGSGSLGLEALSRGAAKCYFNEGNRRNFSVLKGNVEHCKAEDKAVLTNSDFRKALVALEEPVDLAFIDPPYASGFYEEVFELINEYDLLNEGGVIVAEHLHDNPLQDNYGDLTRVKAKKYGTIAVDLFVKG